MTKEEAIKKLEAMAAGSDEEIEHSDADDILLNRLEELGDADVSKAYQDARDRVGFWYA